MVNLLLADSLPRYLHALVGKVDETLVAHGLVTQEVPDKYPRVADPRVDKAVARGLRILARNQESNGAWVASIGRKVHMSYRGRSGSHVGVTALACMSFMAGGSLPGRGLYGENVSRGLEFVLSSTRENGFICANGSRMYSHGFATLFLAEVYGMTRIVGYFSRVNNWNKSKLGELRDRHRGDYAVSPVPAAEVAGAAGT